VGAPHGTGNTGAGLAFLTLAPPLPYICGRVEKHSKAGCAISAQQHLKLCQLPEEIDYILTQVMIPSSLLRAQGQPSSPPGSGQG